MITNRNSEKSKSLILHVKFSDIKPVKKLTKKGSKYTIYTASKLMNNEMNNLLK
jgi:hypothetical protein|tara:strand:+ start:340 stop:501 length:162 start_codon:yes stop_codon:yes gene_type:complete